MNGAAQLRAPAWCDRVLFWTGEDAEESEGEGDGVGAGEGEGGQRRVLQLTYRRSEMPLMSDHKPVSASFRVKTRQVYLYTSAVDATCLTGCMLPLKFHSKT